VISIGKAQERMMNTQTTFCLNRQAMIAAVISAAFPLTTLGAAARVEFAIGSVSALAADGRERALAKGAEINAGDTIQTMDGRAQLRFSDGGYISLQPNTRFKVEEFSFNGKADGSEKGFFSLVKGSLRAITGAIGHTNKNAYRVNTPVATIGIRGTEYLAQYDTKLLVKVGDGAVYLLNDNGDLILYKGQVGEVGGPNDKPKYSNDELSVGAAGPAGGGPLQVQQQQQEQQQLQTVFTVGELRTDTGEPCVITNSCATTGIQPFNIVTEIQTLHANNVTGVYNLDARATNTASGVNGSTGILTAGSLTAYFGSYQVDAAITLSMLSGSASYTAFGSGNILLQNASYSISGGSVSSATCYGSCTFSATGFFSQPGAAKASMNYTIDGTIFGAVTGQADFTR
jgi:hypothetical protein